MNLMGVAGWSGSGKTTLVERLTPALAGLGWRVGVVKHAHHDFDVDVPGKDSHRFRAAGACAVLASSSRRWALVRELRAGEAEADVFAQARRLTTEGECDLVLAEGFKRAEIPKVEVWREELGRPLLCATDERVEALVSDGRPAGVPARVRVFSASATGEIAGFVSARFRKGLGGAAGTR